MNDRQFHTLCALQCQIAATQAQITYWQTLITSGAYADMSLSHLNGSPLTDREKLDHALGVIQNHVNHLRAVQEHHEKKI